MAAELDQLLEELIDDISLNEFDDHDSDYDRWRNEDYGEEKSYKYSNSELSVNQR